MKAAYFTPFILTTAFVLSACVYEPEPFEASTGEISNTESNSNIGKFFAVNNQKQICNPSVSQDTLNFPASMLWLNFGGKLNVNAPDSIYTVSKVVQHDRLTVSDTAGNVRWYLMRDTAKGECQYQDPEWSTHKNFAVALRAYDVDGSKSCENLDYGIFAVRLSDKAKYFFYEKGISEFATPHLWIGDSASYDKKDSSVNAFFESDELRLVYVNKNDEVVFVEFSKNSSTNSKGKILKKPDGVSGWMMDSPMISPDGNFVVFNMIAPSMTEWKSYLQELSPNALPVEIKKEKGMISNPVQPRWFKYGTRTFVLWTEFPQGSQFVNKNDLSQVSVQNGSAGRTAMREILTAAGAPADMSIAWIGDILELAPVPMIAGRSPDGRFLATGTNYGYLLKLP